MQQRDRLVEEHHVAGARGCRIGAAADPLKLSTRQVDYQGQMPDAFSELMGDRRGAERPVEDPHVWFDGQVSSVDLLVLHLLLSTQPMTTEELTQRALGVALGPPTESAVVVTAAQSVFVGTHPGRRVNMSLRRLGVGKQGFLLATPKSSKQARVWFVRAQKRPAAKAELQNAGWP